MRTPSRAPAAAFATAFATAFGAAALAALAACGNQADSVAGFVADKQAPTVRFDTTVKNTPGDSAVRFTVVAADNLDLARIKITVSGGVQMTKDSALGAGTTVALAMQVPVPPSVAPGTPIYVVATARDGAGNTGTSDTLRLSAGNVKPPAVTLVTPEPGALMVVGKRSALTLVATSPLKVRAVGYRTTGAFTFADSTVIAAASASDSVVVTDTLAVPSSATAGVLTVTPFVVDLSGRVANGAAVQYAVQAVGANTSTVPVPSAAFPVRLEAADTLRVAASDPAGVKVIGYEILSRADTTRRFGADSVVLDGSLVNDARRFTLRLRPDTLTAPADSFPLRVFVRGFATNAGGKRATTTLTAAGNAPDTAVVVAGTTNPLPQGGTLADGIYVPRLDRLYLTNIERNQLEVFDLAGRRFLAPVAVGSRPWGIAAWPRAQDGTFADTLLVANSGGTNVSYVDLTSGTGREVYRYPLPNIIAYSVTTVVSPAGDKVQQRTMYDFSDRPQYLATTCSGSASTGAGCAEPILLYSTTPTGGQSVPFPNAGTIRWENLVRHSSHFFFEQAVGLTQGRWDTLMVVRYAAGGVGSDSTLVPYQQPATNVATGAATTYSVEVDLAKLAFRDTTFVRNSGNFGRAIFGEGGPVLGSRGMMYDAAPGLAAQVTSPLRNATYQLSTPVYDLGVSRAFDVTDYIANTFARVAGVAINFDGALGAIRGDSTYLIGPTLRLQGLLQTTGGSNAGFDFHPRNAGPNSAPGTRYAFSASQLPQIEIYDTYCYQRARTIAVRDPIVGPIRASVRANGDLVLVGATKGGVVVVPVPQPIRGGC